MMEEPILEFSGFSFQYDAQAEPTLYGIDLTIHKGEKILISGPSGCGKSTLVHVINGLIPSAYSGTITGSCRLKGRETREMSIFDISHYVGTVLQDLDGQFIGLTVAEDIAFSLENDCMPTEEMHQKVAEIADLVSIGGKLDSAPNELSGGQKQRVSLAGVMVDDVEILLFDEPLANLDPATGKQAIELIDEIHEKTGATIIIVEHRMEDVLWRDVDRIVLMQSGRIISDSAPDELLSGDLLPENGIREPLYITALKYAGVEVTPEMQPHSIRTVQLTEAVQERVRAWFRSTPPAPEKQFGELLLKAENIDFTYENSGHRALNGVSLSVREGELLAIVGKNGAGKSTFSKVVCGFEKQQGGTLHFRDTDLMTLSIKERADHIGYVMQNPNQMISQTMIYDEVAMGLRTRKMPEEQIRPHVEETLKICGLWPFRNWPVSALSFGQKKRVTIASILVLEPEIIILDEPTAGQDYRHYTDIMEFLTELNARGITVILITHDMHLILEYADRAVVFSDSSVIASDSSANILTERDVIRRANLKETSLYELALRCGIDDARGFVQRFIDYEREVVRK